MRRRLIPVLTILALVVAISACGDDGGTVFDGSTTTAAGSTTTVEVTTTGGGGSSALAGMVSSALAEGADVATSTGTGEEEQCITSGLAGVIGADRFAELDAIATTAADMSPVFSAMTDAELSALIDVVYGCVDVRAMLTEEMTADEDFSPEAAACFADSLAQGDTMKPLIKAMMTGGDLDTDPESIQILVRIMTQDCADPLEAMLVDQFMANGASAESAACVAEEFMRGGLFEAILSSTMGGTDSATDPDLVAQMEQIFMGCLTPEELANMGIVQP